MTRRIWSPSPKIRAVEIVPVGIPVERTGGVEIVRVADCGALVATLGVGPRKLCDLHFCPPNALFLAAGVWAILRSHDAAVRELNGDCDHPLAVVHDPAQPWQPVCALCLRDGWVCRGCSEPAFPGHSCRGVS